MDRLGNFCFTSTIVRQDKIGFRAKRIRNHTKPFPVEPLPPNPIIMTATQIDQTPNLERDLNGAEVEINHGLEAITFFFRLPKVCDYKIEPRFNKRGRKPENDYMRDVLNGETVNAPEIFYSELLYDHKSKVVWADFRKHYRPLFLDLGYRIVRKPLT